ncbi:PREDICTED: mesoderm development candidate 1-like [Amphimedon queenslandica]|uniref:Talin IBS2B domain-containing protein n=1 Tax=Amphimedon queenslandica TaxID=400682 RepID=A0A1X7VU19_AMPQE|nr:PREDICTED: mesoderm development candidate 1-like [Amphimedon queenslandica]|eukprot:XP_011404674.1 PREDICTED: mesoderm development candidate 1-like [Amphimedon queenslandica]
MTSAPRSPLYILSAREVSRSCEEATELMELVAELLLLRSGSKSTRAPPLHPFSLSDNSYSKSRDAIVANTKGLAIAIKDLTRQLKDESFADVERTVRSISEKVTILIEATSHAAYITALSSDGTSPAKPGPIDQYSFAKSRLIISNTCNKFSSERGSTLSNDDMLELTQTIASNLTILRQNCQQASTAESIGELAQNQFSACVQSLDGTSSAFVSSVKGFLTSGRGSDKKKVAMFTVALAAAVNSVAGFAALPEFAGGVASFSTEGEQNQTEMLARAMSVVSASVQMLNTVTQLIDNKIGSAKSLNLGEKKISDEKHWQRLVSCTRAVAESCKMLASSIREHTPFVSPQGTPPIPRANQTT